MAFCDGLGTVLIERVGTPVDRLLEVRANVVEVDCRLLLQVPAFNLGFFDEGEGITGSHDITNRHGDVADDAAPLGDDDVLHLHRLDDGHLLPCPYLVPNCNIEGNDCPLNGRGNCHRPLWSLGGPLRGWL